MKITDGFTYLTEVKSLIVAYTDSLGRDLSFQNLNAELADLQKKYGFPAGRLLAAIADNGNVVGCVAYCRHSAVRCEMKRLYVLPAYRKDGIGQALLTEIVIWQKQTDTKKWFWIPFCLWKAPSACTAEMGLKKFLPITKIPWMMCSISGVN